MTTTVNIDNMLATWNDAGTDFVGIFKNINDVASGAGSKLLDLRRNNVSLLTMGKNVTGGSGLTLGDASSGGGSTWPYLVFDTAWGDVNFTNWGGQLSIGGPGILNFAVSGPGYFTTLIGLGGNKDTADLRLYRDAAGVLALRNGANEQTLRVYNFGDTVNGEFLEFGWNANVAEISPKAVGTGTNRAAKYWLDGQYAFLLGNHDGYRVELTTRYGTEFFTSNLGVLFSRGIGFTTGGNNPTRMRPTAKNTTPAFPSAGTSDLHIEAGYGYASSPQGSSLKLAAGYGGTPASAGAGGRGGNIELWIGEGGVENTSGGKGADGEFKIFGVSNAGSFASSPLFSVDFSGLVKMPSLPTADPGIAGALWNNSGTLAISAG